MKIIFTTILSFFDKHPALNRVFMIPISLGICVGPIIAGVFGAMTAGPGGAFVFAAVGMAAGAIGGAVIGAVGVGFCLIGLGLNALYHRVRSGAQDKKVDEDKVKNVSDPVDVVINAAVSSYANHLTPLMSPPDATAISTPESSIAKNQLTTLLVSKPEIKISPLRRLFNCFFAPQKEVKMPDAQTVNVAENLARKRVLA